MRNVRNDFAPSTRTLLVRCASGSHRRKNKGMTRLFFSKVEMRPVLSMRSRMLSSYSCAAGKSDLQLYRKSPITNININELEFILTMFCGGMTAIRRGFSIRWHSFMVSNASAISASFEPFAVASRCSSNCSSSWRIRTFSASRLI